MAKGLLKWLWGWTGRWKEPFRAHLPLLPLRPGVLLPVANISPLSSSPSQQPPAPLTPAWLCLCCLGSEARCEGFAPELGLDFVQWLETRGRKQALSLGSSRRRCGPLCSPRTHRSVHAAL